jgi:hypothetical protein
VTEAKSWLKLVVFEHRLDTDTLPVPARFEHPPEIVENELDATFL